MHDRKSEQVAVRFTPEQLEEVKVAAKRLGMSVSEYLRWSAETVYGSDAYDKEHERFVLEITGGESVGLKAVSED